MKNKNKKNVEPLAIIIQKNQLVKNKKKIQNLKIQKKTILFLRSGDLCCRLPKNDIEILSNQLPTLSRQSFFCGCLETKSRNG